MTPCILLRHRIALFSSRSQQFYFNSGAIKPSSNSHDFLTGKLRTPYIRNTGFSTGTVIPQPDGNFLSKYEPFLRVNFLGAEIQVGNKCKRQVDEGSG